MKIRLKGFRRLLIESALIVFSVLFALFINRYAENQKIERQKEVALERIIEEMKDNRRILDSAMHIHQTIISNLRRAATDEQDTLRTYLAQQGYFSSDVLGLISNGSSFFPEFPKSTSWDAAVTTGIVAEFDYNIVTAATEVYTSQGFITEELMPSFIQVLYTPVDPEEIKTINILSMRFVELADLEGEVVKQIDRALGVIYPPDTVQVTQ
ncbi:hypothetical protein [Tunicatimonas pelagia]|uniref:hypothetical protein n=1 Tax=Tunicatimonas pelagia TaxID=931531 RepID=UPI002666EBF7|nr:hypothetical protein [Tunicatimonas pelagia]WKN41872.1 hypothetical protein P0M28_22795 [Tunicatimonas pelagia]